MRENKESLQKELKNCFIELKDRTWDNEILAYVAQIHEYKGKQDALLSCPSLGSSSVESALKKLVEEGAIIRTGSGRKTMYMINDN